MCANWVHIAHANITRSAICAQVIRICKVCARNPTSWPENYERRVHGEMKNRIENKTCGFKKSYKQLTGREPILISFLHFQFKPTATQPQSVPEDKKVIITLWKMWLLSLNDNINLTRNVEYHAMLKYFQILFYRS